MLSKAVVRGASLFAFTLLLAAAQELPPAGQQVFRAGSGVSAPVLIQRLEPEYSDEARRARYQGTVVLSLVIDENGAPNNIQVVRRLGMGLDEKAVEAVQQWLFRPGMKDGRPVKVRVNVEVNFRLLLRGWSVGSLEFSLAPGTANPALDKERFEAPKSRVPGNVSLAFDVDVKGKPKNVRVVRSSNRALEIAAVASVRKWHFQHAIRDGQPVSASGTIDLTFHP